MVYNNSKTSRMRVCYSFELSFETQFCVSQYECMSLRRSTSRITLSGPGCARYAVFLPDDRKRLVLAFIERQLNCQYRPI